MRRLRRAALQGRDKVQLWVKALTLSLLRTVPILTTESGHGRCGWPAFYDAIPGKVTQHVDSSWGMQRIEICCSSCGGHLGHLFVRATPLPECFERRRKAECAGRKARATRRRRTSAPASTLSRASRTYPNERLSCSSCAGSSSARTSNLARRRDDVTVQRRRRRRRRWACEVVQRAYIVIHGTRRYAVERTGHKGRARALANTQTKGAAAGRTGERIEIELRSTNNG